MHPNNEHHVEMCMGLTVLQITYNYYTSHIKSYCIIPLFYCKKKTQEKEELRPKQNLNEGTFH